MMLFNKSVAIALLFAGALVGCGENAIEPEQSNDVVNFTVSVGVSKGTQIPDAAKKAVTRGYTDNLSSELMHTLRFIIVRPNGTVEHNRFYDFTTNAPIEMYEQAFKVVSGETKKVYLVANERTTKAGNAKVINYDFNSIIPGKQFPENEYNNLLITLNSNNEELPTPLVMSECRTVNVPANRDLTAEMFIVRAASKFTFTIKNNSSDVYNITKLTMDKMARKEYFLPRSTTGETQYDKTTGELINYVVPTVGNNEYYTFEKTLSYSVQQNQTVTIPSFYLLEGRYTDSANAKNYKMSLTMNGTVFSEYFPNMKDLPRNVHVVVNVSISQKSVEWSTSIHPYNAVELRPGFGF